MADQSTNQPSNSGGLFGMDPQLLINVGLGLMSAAKPYGNVGDSVSGAIHNYQQQKANTLQQQLGTQQLGMNQLQMRMLQARLPAMQKWFDTLGGLMGDPQPQGAGAQGAGASQGPMAPPQGAPPGLLTTGGPQMPGPMGSPPGASPAPAAMLGGAPLGALNGAPLGAPGGAMPPQGAAAQGAAPQIQPTSGGGAPSADPFAWARMGTFGAMAGMPGGQEAMEYGKFLAQNDPAMIARQEAAKGTVATDLEQIRQANAGGNQQLAGALQQKLRQDLGLLHIASMSGTQTRIGQDGSISTFNPNEGVQSNNGIESAIPGAAQARGEIAGAVSRGEATGKTIKLTDAKGNEYEVPMSTVTGGPGGGARAPGAPLPRPAGPASAAGAAPGPFMSSIGPGASTMLKGTAEQAVKENEGYQSQAEAGQQMLTQTQELRDAALDFSPGQFAQSRIKALQWANSTGLITPQQMQSLGSAQAGQKIAIQLQAAATKQLGSREAAQIFTYMGKSLPNLELSQNGLDKVSAYMDGMARYNMMRAQVSQQRSSANDANGVNSVRNEFIQNTNPLYFIVASAPPDIRQQMVDSMGKQKATFLAGWNNALKNNWAPKPSQYMQ